MNCKTEDVDPLNTSDHTAISIYLDTQGVIQRGCVDCDPPDNIRWHKLSHEQMIDRYQTPLGAEIDALFNKYEQQNQIDTLMDEMKDMKKLSQNTIIERNVKPFRCDELNELEHDEVKAYRAWCSALGTPITPITWRIRKPKVRSGNALNA